MLSMGMSKQQTERQKSMRQYAIDYLHFLTDREMMVERVVDRRLMEMQPRIQQMIDEQVALRLKESKRNK